MSAELTLVLDSQCALGESPVWWADAGVLVFVDITGRRLHRFDPRSGRHEVDVVEEDIGCVAAGEGRWLCRRVAFGDLAVGCRGRQGCVNSPPAESRAIPPLIDSTTVASIRGGVTSRALSMSRRPGPARGCIATIGVA